jgi:hypothetical protein
MKPATQLPAVATARPWIRTNGTDIFSSAHPLGHGDVQIADCSVHVCVLLDDRELNVGEARANAELIVTAVNAYDRNQATIAAAKGEIAALEASRAAWKAEAELARTATIQSAALAEALKVVGAELRKAEATIAKLKEALEAVNNWLVCAPIASAEDFISGVIPMQKKVAAALKEAQ